MISAPDTRPRPIGLRPYGRVGRFGAFYPCAIAVPLAGLASSVAHRAPPRVERFAQVSRFELGSPPDVTGGLDGLPAAPEGDSRERGAAIRVAEEVPWISCRRPTSDLSRLNA